MYIIVKLVYFFYPLYVHETSFQTPLDLELRKPSWSITRVKKFIKLNFKLNFELKMYKKSSYL